MDIFAFPEYFWVLIPAFLAALAVLWWTPRQRQKILKLLIQSPALREKLSGGAQGDLRTLKGWLFAGACILTTLALLGPQWGLKSEEIPQLGGNLIIALDLSDSMLAEDVKPNRLDRAKFELIDAFVKKKKDKPFRVGVVTFAGKAYLQCPMTLDSNALRYVLETVSPGTLPHPGTNIGAALKVSQTMLKTVAGSKHILLVTDGEDHGGEGQAAAKDLQKAGIKVSALWLGSPAGEPIPLRDENGNFLGYKKDKDGNTVLSKAREDTLVSLTQSTGGKFIKIGDGSNTVQELVEILAGNSKMKGKEKRLTLENRFQWPLALAFLLLIAEFIIPERKTRRA